MCTHLHAYCHNYPGINQELQHLQCWSCTLSNILQDAAMTCLKLSCVAPSSLDVSVADFGYEPVRAEGKKSPF